MFVLVDFEDDGFDGGVAFDEDAWKGNLAIGFRFFFGGHKVGGRRMVRKGNRRVG